MKNLTPEQLAAVERIRYWFHAAGSSPFFLLQGPAGTGKTFCVQELLKDKAIGRICFTAPTNKATRVLRQTLTQPNYKPEACTIFSLLGLRLEANGELKELTVPEDDVDLNDYGLVVIDEGSMINQTLFLHLERASRNSGCKFLVMADKAQLPPVGEKEAPIWKIAEQAHLTTIMRYDNQILEFATKVRKAQDSVFPAIQIKESNSGGEGIFVINGLAFQAAIRDAASAGQFAAPEELTDPQVAKIITWRNVRVDEYNKIVRSALYGKEAVNYWLPGDRVLFTAPAKDLEDEKIASTDDEGTIERVSWDWHPLYPEFKVDNILIATDAGTTVVARVLHKDCHHQFSAEIERLAAIARIERRKWKDYWAFREAFHQLRHGYAITAHRAQGSTYERVFVDWRDILTNPNRGEAFKCLYVAATRAKKQVLFN